MWHWNIFKLFDDNRNVTPKKVDNVEVKMAPKEMQLFQPVSPEAKIWPFIDHLTILTEFWCLDISQMHCGSNFPVLSGNSSQICAEWKNFSWPFRFHVNSSLPYQNMFVISPCGQPRLTLWIGDRLEVGRRDAFAVVPGYRRGERLHLRKLNKLLKSQTLTLSNTKGSNSSRSNSRQLGTKLALFLSKISTQTLKWLRFQSSMNLGIRPTNFITRI